MSFSLRPDRVLDTYQQADSALLHALGVRLLLTDLDYTLAPKRVKEPDEKLYDWIRELERGGIQVAILSNNRSPKRVRKFCSVLGIDYVGHAKKPLRTGYLRAMEKFGTGAGETAMLGDKLLTDCLGAHRAGLTMLMVEPSGGAVSLLQKVLYLLQEPFKRSSPHDMRKKAGK